MIVRGTFEQTVHWLERICRPVPLASDGACALCHGARSPDHAASGREAAPAGWSGAGGAGTSGRCPTCRLVSTQVPFPCGRMMPVALYQAPGPLHTLLRCYKDGPDDGAAELLALLLGAFLRRHERCICAPGSEVGVVTVPSTSRRRPPDPLRSVTDRLPWLAERRIEALEATAHGAGHRRASTKAFTLRHEVVGRRLLVLDDTWTTGARAQSAASTLASGGARVEGIVVIGRLVRPCTDPSSRALWAAICQRRYERERCCLEPQGDEPTL